MNLKTTLITIVIIILFVVCFLGIGILSRDHMNEQRKNCINNNGKVLESEYGGYQGCIYGE